MGLKEGTLVSLIESGVNAVTLAMSVFPQMLQALDFIASKDIVHRDVKPENILYVSLPNGKYQFQLGDFGLCNRALFATSHAGTDVYMAPEIVWGGIQTHKVDVWSLYVTLIWTMDISDFRRKSHEFKSLGEIRQAISFIASNAQSVSTIREMAIVNPDQRASAAQMLVKYFGGEGLSTRRSQVPPLSTNPPLPVTASRTTSPSIGRQTTGKQPADSKTNVKQIRGFSKSPPMAINVALSNLPTVRSRTIQKQPTGLTPNASRVQPVRRVQKISPRPPV